MSSSSQASQRINALLDENSFVEIGALVTARSTDFNLKQEETPSDGVVTGYGVIDGNLVYVYSQDASVLGGSIGEMHAKKIVRLYELAIKTGSPVIGLIDSAGLRLQEATDALNAFAVTLSFLVSSPFPSIFTPSRGFLTIPFSMRVSTVTVEPSSNASSASKLIATIFNVLRFLNPLLGRRLYKGI